MTDDIMSDVFVLVVVTVALWLWVWIVPVRVIKVQRLHLGGRGLALPGFIFLTENAWDERVLRHELVHQGQMKKYSPLGVALMLGWHYGRGFLLGRIQHGCWPSFISLWQSNALEIEANAAMASNEPLPRLIGWQD